MPKKLLGAICVATLSVASLFNVHAENFSVLSGQKTTESVSRENRRQQDADVNSSGFKITVDVPLVTTDVTVIGNSVPEFQPADFIIYDNGVAQQISYFARDISPLAVAVLIDGSESIRSYMPMLQIAAVSALRRLKPEDQVALFSFNYNSTKLCDLTADRFRIADKIGDIKIAFGTDIFDTLYDAARYLCRKAPNRRRAIILVSDNCHNAYGGRGADSTLIALLKSATTLYSIRTPGDWGSGCAVANAQIGRVADGTGGETFNVRESISLPAVLEKAIFRLREQYTLGFNPSSSGKIGSFHSLAVKLVADNRCPGCQLLARKGYYAGIRAPSPPAAGHERIRQDSQQETDQLLIQRIITVAGTIDLDLPDVPFTAQTEEQTGLDGQPQLKIKLDLEPSAIKFKTVEDCYACRMRVAVFYANAKGKIIGSEWRMLEELLHENAYNKAREAGIEFSITVPLKAQARIVKIILYDTQSDKFGSKLIRLASP